MEKVNLTDEQKQTLELRQTLKTLCVAARKEYFALNDYLCKLEEAVADSYNDDCEVKTLNDYCIDVAIPSTYAALNGMHLFEVLKKIDKIVDEA